MLTKKVNEERCHKTVAWKLGKGSGVITIQVDEVYYGIETISNIVALINVVYKLAWQ